MGRSRGRQASAAVRVTVAPSAANDPHRALRRRDDAMTDITGRTASSRSSPTDRPGEGAAGAQPHHGRARGRRGDGAAPRRGRRSRDGAGGAAGGAELRRRDRHRAAQDRDRAAPRFGQRRGAPRRRRQRRAARARRPPRRRDPRRGRLRRGVAGGGPRAARPQRLPRRRRRGGERHRLRARRGRGEPPHGAQPHARAGGGPVLSRLRRLVPDLDLALGGPDPAGHDLVVNGHLAGPAARRRPAPRSCRARPGPAGGRDHHAAGRDPAAPRCGGAGLPQPIRACRCWRVSSS